MADSDSDDDSVVDSLSAISATALDGTTALLQRGLERGRLAETVEKHQLDVQRAATYCLFKLTEPCAVSATATATEEAAAAAGAEGVGASGDDDLAGPTAACAAAASAPALAAAGLKQLLSHPRLGMLVGRDLLTEVLVQVVEQVAAPGVLTAALDVFCCVLAGSANGRQQNRRQATCLARVSSRCLELLAGGAAAAAPQAQPAEAPQDVSLALAALRFFINPLARLPELQPEQRAELAAHATALLRAQLPVQLPVQGAAGGGAAAAAAATAGEGDATAVAAAPAGVTDCLELLRALLQLEASDDSGSSGSSTQTALASSSSSSSQGPAALPHALMAAGGAAVLVPLLQAPAASRRVLQLLLWVAAAGAEAQQEVTAALVEACGQCPEVQRQLVGAAGACVTELRQQRTCTAEASAPAAAARAERATQLLLEVVAAVVEAQPSLAGALLLPDWGGQPLLRVALAGLGVGGAEGVRQSSLPAAVAPATAALRLLHLLLVRCGPPPQSSLPVTAQELMPALVRLAAASAAEDGGDGGGGSSGGVCSLVLDCVHACVRGMAPREAADALCAAASGGRVLKHIAGMLAHSLQCAGGGNGHRAASVMALGELEQLQLAACLLEAGWAEVERCGLYLEYDLLPPAAALDVRRLATTLLAWQPLHRQLTEPAGAAVALALRTLHAALSIFRVTCFVRKGDAEAGVTWWAEAAVADGLVGALVDLLLLRRAPVPPQQQHHAALALQVLSMLVHCWEAVPGVRGDLLEQIQKHAREGRHALDACAMLLPAAAHVLRGLLPPEQYAQVLPLLPEEDDEVAGGAAASEEQAAQVGQRQDGQPPAGAEGEECHGRDCLERWREVMATYETDVFHSACITLGVGVALLSGIGSGWNANGSGGARDACMDQPTFKRCVEVFALGYITCCGGPGSLEWQTTAVADLLRPLAPHLPRQQLLQLVHFVGGWAADSESVRNPLAGETHERLRSVLLCLSACCESPLLLDEDLPELAERNEMELCCVLTCCEREPLPHLVKLACRWCLRLGGRRQQHGRPEAAGAPTAAVSSGLLGQTASAVLQAALRLAEGSHVGVAGPAAPAALLADCVLAVCDSALSEMYGSGLPPQLLHAASSGAPSSDGDGSAAASSTAANSAQAAAVEQLRRLGGEVQQVYEALALQLERGAVGAAGGPSATGGGAGHAVVGDEQQVLLVRAALRAGHWAAELKDQALQFYANKALDLDIRASHRADVADSLRRQAGVLRGDLDRLLLRASRPLLPRTDNQQPAKNNDEATFVTACRRGDLQHAMRLQQQDGVSVNARDTRGRTGLYRAAGEGRLKVVEWLLESGADVNAVGNRQTGDTALHRAAACGFVGVVQVLLGAGADMSTTNTAGKLPREVARNQDVRELL
ncbi:hypothetical protein HYH02_012367 [Chlamydomonas schloesseri]|uniref:Uncharacterized protein n=1 Tax=Chlamydomonas schloesseri TaxID=2026947 RepID=A0A835W386_9CHLO|nr:hypothetical protein HYH02_012367 [Chlamydomonas schloesseri]|eukprot:KAG2434351.1 hypothetical protein HYH02_012367 [Chlamydomonas schloesseri]